METTLRKDLEARISKLAAVLPKGAAAIMTIPVNIYYFAGRIVNGYVYVNYKGENFVFLRRPTGISEDGYHYIRKVEMVPEMLQQMGVEMPETLMLELCELPYLDCLRLQKAFGNVPIKDVSKTIKEIRSVKSEYEIDQFRKAAALQSEAYRELPALYKTGMTDHELCAAVEYLFRKKGCLGIFRTAGPDMEGYMGSLLAGENAGEPSPYDFALGGAGMHPSLPLGHNGRVLMEGTSVMADINGNFNGYIADQSRTFSIGRLPDNAYYAHSVSIEIHNEIALRAKAGTVCEDLWNLAVSIAQKHNLQECFMGKKQQAKFVGHGIGLQINELPVLCPRNTALLQAGNVIAVEPKFIIDGVGAVGVENSYVISSEGAEKITTAPEEIIDIANAEL